MKKTTKQTNTTKKQAKKKQAKKRVATSTRMGGLTIPTSIEDTQEITMRVARGVRVDGRLTMLPRSTKDRRVREWTSEETHQAKEWYKKGMTRNTIAKLLDVSHAPLNKMLFKEGVLSPKHIVAAYKSGYLK